jgi:YD repeat-containing protein
MTDPQGSTSYGYNQLSRMTSETRTIAGLGNYTIGYDYNLAGELKSITDPAGATINYGFDGTGRLNAVTGSTFGGVTTYASGLQYRAWGGLKHLAYGNSRTMDTAYNSRLQASSFTIPGVMSKTYDYSADGSLHFSSESLNHHYDRAYSYDHAGRLTQALSGAEARGEPATNDRPYNETFSYDGFSHLSSRHSNIWSWVSPYSIPDSYLNNRSSNSDYDADGRMLGSIDATYSYDAAGDISTVGTDDPQSTTARALDGDGQQVKTIESTYNENSQSWTTTTTYYVRSTVLGGQVLTELNESGAKHRTFVYVGSQVLATQEIFSYYGTQGVTWEHRDPSNATFRTTMTTGDISEYTELDPTGADATSDPNPILGGPNEEGTGSLLPYPSFSTPTRPSLTYRVDGLPVSVDYFMMVLDNNFHGSFSGGSLRSSIVGFQDSGSRFGIPFSATYDLDGRLTNLSEGEFDKELLWSPLSNLTTPIYGTSLSWAFNLLPQNTTTIPLGNLKANLQSLLKHGDCEQFTNRLLAALAKNYADPNHQRHINTAMEGYDMIAAQGDYVLKQTSYDTVGGDLFNDSLHNDVGPGTVLIVPNRLYTTPTPAQTALFQALYAFTALHETFHLGKRGGYTDEQVATAAFGLDGIEMPTNTNGGPVSSLEGYARATFFSDKFDEALKRHCGYPSP